MLLSATVPAMAPTGWPTSVFFHQPSFEGDPPPDGAQLGADVRLGHEVTGIDQDDDGVTVSTAGAGPVRARYVVGCDGARSMTRKAIGTDLRDSGFEEPWLVVDLFVDEDAPDCRHVASRCATRPAPTPSCPCRAAGSASSSCSSPASRPTTSNDPR